jgi:hypothetical protein
MAAPEVQRCYNNRYTTKSFAGRQTPAMALLLSHFWLGWRAEWRSAKGEHLIISVRAEPVEAPMNYGIDST